MEKRYQVFISSTFNDLQEERKIVLNTLLMADCIPAGMESFVATDDEQFNVIKKVIDLCDYYILIIGGKYGSINDTTKKSYTEMEYDYALSKDIPVLVFALDDSVELPDNKIESDVIKQGKLAEFKNRALSSRLASVWKDSGDLTGKIAISIMKAKQEIVRPGWTRGGEFDQIKLLEQIVELQKQNKLLQEQLEEYKNVSEEIEEELPFYNHKITLHFTEKIFIIIAGDTIREKNVETTLDELFKFISLQLTAVHTLSEFIEAVSAFESGYSVDKQDALIVKNQYIQLGLFTSSINRDNQEVLQLTKKGIKIMNELNLLRK